MTPKLACAVLGSAVIALAVRAEAQERVQTSLSATVAEVSQPFKFTLEVLTTGSSMPSAPSLTVPPGVSAQGPSIGTKSHVTMGPGGVRSERGITATWVLVAATPGKLTIGPARATIDGRSVHGTARSIEIVPAGKGPRTRTPSAFDPFGFGLGPLFGQADPNEEDLELLPAVPDDYSVRVADDATAFVRAITDPTRAVVGEQVTLRVYGYGSRGPFREAGTSEPTRADFLSFSVLENSLGERVYRVPIDGTVWHAVKVREIALFPLRTGRLEIGSMKLGFQGRGYPSASPHTGLVRHSRAITVDVEEPPATGRPPGYRIGDVGRFTLSATVEPRRVKQGEAVSVIAKLQGSGNLPHSIEVPAQRDVEWLEPTIVGEVEPRGTTVGGWRKLAYVVRLDRAGTVDLGELALPFWDPSRDAYDVARTILGSIEVEPAAIAGAAEPVKEDPLALLNRPRVIGSAPPRASHLADFRGFWGLVVGAPLFVAVSGGAIGLARRTRNLLRERRDAPRARARHALAEARAASKAGDHGKAASAAERAIFIAIEGATQLRARALLKDELAPALEKAGVTGECARDVLEALDACDRLRFAGTTDSSDVCERAARVAEELGRTGTSA